MVPESPNPKEGYQSTFISNKNSTTINNIDNISYTIG